MSNIVTGLLIVFLLMGFIYIFTFYAGASFMYGSRVNLLADVLQYFEQAFIDLFTYIGGDVEEFFVDLGDDIVNSALYIEKEIEEGFDIMIDEMNAIFDGFEGEITKYMDKFLSYITVGIDYMIEDIEICYTVMTGAIVDACDTMINQILIFTTEMISGVDKAFTFFMTYLPDAIYDEFLDLYNDMVGWAFALGATLEQFFNDCADGLIYAGSELVEYGQKIYDSLINGLITIENGVIKYVDDIGKDITKGLDPTKW